MSHVTPDGDSGRVGVDDKSRHPLCSRFGIRFGEHKVESAALLRHSSVCDPHLASVDHVRISLLLGGRFDALDVASCARLRDSVRCLYGRFDEPSEVLLFLLLASSHDQGHRAERVGFDRRHHSRASPASSSIITQLVMQSRCIPHLSTRLTKPSSHACLRSRSGAARAVVLCRILNITVGKLPRGEFKRLLILVELK